MISSKAKLKPLISKKLSALGLNNEIVEAQGNTITYLNELGETKSASDFIGGYGANLLGHNHPNVKKVVQEHLEKNSIVHGQLSLRRPSQQLATELSTYFYSTFGESAQCFLGNTGSEAVEIALKLCILKSSIQRDSLLEFHSTKIELTEEAQDLYSKFSKSSFTEEQNFSALERFNSQQFDSRPWLALENSYHGKTLLSLSVTSSEQFRSPFSAHLDPVEFVKLTDSDLKLTIPVFSSSYDGRVLKIDVD